MAKLKGPLFSLGATQQLGKALVYFGWKGLDVVREYVVPSNPNTALQQTQRAYVTAAVAKVHEVQALIAHPLDSVDITAYALWASVVKAATTWFNQIVKNWVDTEIFGDIPCIWADGEITDTTANSIDMVIFANQARAPNMANATFFFGTSRTSLVYQKAATVDPGASASLIAEDCSAFLTAGIKYFWQLRPNVGDPCEHANSGIYHFVAT